jgi:hypothetical protein
MTIDTPENLLLQDFSGNCYVAAMRWITATKERDWFVVHGVIWSDLLGKRIGHAWCERGEIVVDLVLPVRSKIVPRERYYRHAHPEISKRYSTEEALLLSLKYRHSGPWEEIDEGQVERA